MLSCPGLLFHEISLLLVLSFLLLIFNHLLHRTVLEILLLLLDVHEVLLVSLLLLHVLSLILDFFLDALLVSLDVGFQLLLEHPILLLSDHFLFF